MRSAWNVRWQVFLIVSFFLLLRQKIQRILDHPAQLCRRVDAAAPADLVRDRFCQLLTVRLVGVLIEHPGKVPPA